MTPEQQAAADEITLAYEGDGPVHVFEGSAGDDDVIVLAQSDTRIISIDSAGEMTSGFIVPGDPGADAGWEAGYQ